MHVMCVCFKKCSKNILSAKMCVEIATYILLVVCMECAGLENVQKKFKVPKCLLKFSRNFESIQKCVVFISLKTAQKIHRNIYYMLYA